MLTLASQGVFRTIQGEGALIGASMIFVRFAGCSVGCLECDTNYTKTETVTINELIRRIENIRNTQELVWLTGGEPTDQKHIHYFAKELKLLKLDVAIATAGIRLLPTNIYNWISVSPHSTEDFNQNYGDELKIIPNLNGFKLSDINKLNIENFTYKFVQPLENQDPKECIDFVTNNPTWRLTLQAHKIWNIQ